MTDEQTQTDPDEPLRFDDDDEGEPWVLTFEKVEPHSLCCERCKQAREALSRGGWVRLTEEERRSLLGFIEATSYSRSAIKSVYAKLSAHEGEPDA